MLAAASPERISKPQFTLMPCWLKVCEGWTTPPATKALPITNNKFPMMLPNNVNFTTRRYLRQATHNACRFQCCLSVDAEQPKVCTG
jgi:hypothetical protein